MSCIGATRFDGFVPPARSTAAAVIRCLMVPVVLILVVFACHGAWAQTGKTIKFVVPAAPGGVGDTAARLFANEIARAQGQTVLIENRTGAGGAIAADAVARAAPDGNTLFATGSDRLVTPHARKLSFDMLTAFEPICQVLIAPTVIIVNAASPFRTLDDLVSAARGRPGSLTMASFGPATAFQIAFERFRRAVNVDMIFLPYPGNAPAVTALLGEHVTSAYTTYSTASEQLSAGKVRALATGSHNRIDILPDVPTIAESGLNGYEFNYWLGFVAPAKTPPDRISRLTAWFLAALQAPELKAKLVPLGLYPAGVCDSAFAALLRNQYEEIGEVMRAANLKVE
jgi:tripartite-type tricarboxylate transporter receptor subunit TctC